MTDLSGLAQQTGAPSLFQPNGTVQVPSIFNWQAQPLTAPVPASSAADPTTAHLLSSLGPLLGPYLAMMRGQAPDAGTLTGFEGLRETQGTTGDKSLDDALERLYGETGGQGKNKGVDGGSHGGAPSPDTAQAAARSPGEFAANSLAGLGAVFGGPLGSMVGLARGGANLASNGMIGSPTVANTINDLVDSVFGTNYGPAAQATALGNDLSGMSGGVVGGPGSAGYGADPGDPGYGGGTGPGPDTGGGSFGGADVGGEGGSPY